MNYRHFISTTILLSLCVHITLGQKITLYHSLDSVKKIEQRVTDSLKQTKASNNTIHTYTKQYTEIIDSIRDEAHDCADSIIEHMDRFSHFELGVDMVSNQYYYGRRGPAAGAVGSLSLNYVNKTGLYTMFNTDIYDIKYSAIRIKKLGKQDTISGQKTEPDITLTAGFLRTFFEKWNVELYYDHTFIFYGTDKNLLSNTLDLSTGFDFWDYITAKVEYQFLFGGASTDPAKRKQSNVLTFDLYKDFKIYRLPGAAVLSIEPEIISNVGNDNLSRSRVIARNRHGGLDVPQVYDNFFGLLDAEAALNINYRIKNLELSLSPHLVIPFNEIPTSLPPSVTTSAQLAPYRQNQMQAPIFYATVGIKYLFKFWKEQPKKSLRTKTKKAAK